MNRAKMKLILSSLCPQPSIDIHTEIMRQNENLAPFKFEEATYF